MIGPTPIRLSASAVKDFNNCPYRYARTYLSPLPDCEREPVTVLAFGDVVHRVLADFIRRGGWAAVTKIDAFGILRSHWRKNVYADDDLSIVNFERAAGMVERFVDIPYPAHVARELDVERRISWPRFHRGLMAAGRLDRTCVLTNGAVEIIDYKTGHQRLDADQLSLEPQALFMRSLGAVAYRHLAPTSIKVSFLYLASGVPTSVDFEEDDFLYGWARIEAVAAKIQTGIQEVIAGRPVLGAFPPNRGERCRYCPFRRHCNTVVSPGLAGTAFPIIPTP